MEKKMSFRTVGNCWSRFLFVIPTRPKVCLFTGFLANMGPIISLRILEPHHSFKNINIIQISPISPNRVRKIISCNFLIGLGKLMEESP